MNLMQLLSQQLDKFKESWFPMLCNKFYRDIQEMITLWKKLVGKLLNRTGVPVTSPFAFSSRSHICGSALPNNQIRQ